MPSGDKPNARLRPILQWLYSTILATEKKTNQD